MLGGGGTNIGEQLRVAEQIDCGLVVQQDPVLWDASFTLRERECGQTISV